MIQRSTLALGICLAFLGASAVQAHDVALAGDIEVPSGNSGYVSVGGKALRTGGGECLRLGGFSEDTQIDACEGIEATAEVEPEPEPVVEAEPEPEPEPEQVARVELKEMNDQANFEFDSADLTAEGQAAMDQLFGELAAFKGVTAISVVGHTDSTGPEEYNQTLSEQRAATVAAILSERYPEASVSMDGAGESAPIATNETREGRSMNRRVDIDITASRMTFE